MLATKYRPETIMQARNQIYPGWWTYGCLEHTPEALLPWRRVICGSISELEMAVLSRPPFERIELVLEGPQFGPNSITIPLAILREECKE